MWGPGPCACDGTRGLALAEVPAPQAPAARALCPAPIPSSLVPQRLAVLTHIVCLLLLIWPEHDAASAAASAADGAAAGAAEKSGEPCARSTTVFSALHGAQASEPAEPATATGAGPAAQAPTHVRVQFGGTSGLVRGKVLAVHRRPPARSKVRLGLGSKGAGKMQLIN